MTYAQLMLYVTTIGKDKIYGFNFDNSRRVVRSVKNGALQSFDDRFTIDETLEAIIISDSDQFGIPFKTYIPIDTVQGIYAVDNPGDVEYIDKRYSVG